MDWAVQKCVELGVSRVIPFESKFCTVKDKGNKLDRLRRIAISACKQSGLAYLPDIGNTIHFEQLLQNVANVPQTILAYEGATQNAKEVLSKLDPNKDVAIIIGSEGGFSPDEVEALKNVGAKVISLGKTILRVETACVALLSAIMYEMNNWERT
jgi:16S rRNA (uracil1498-N3)-methyltransferase